MLKVLDKASENTYYIRSLLSQTYCDLNLPIRDIKISNNLSEFNKNYHNKKKKLNE
jgi:hypothetical protein